MKEKPSLLILFGGASSEHEVSCASAASVLSHIDSEKYRINTIGITKEGNWLLTGSPVVHIGDGSWQKRPGNRRAILCPDRQDRGILVENQDGTFERISIDVVFPVLHGKNGEDGTIQGLLQVAGIPFVGSDTVASAASMDKAITKAMVEQACIVSQAKCWVEQKKVFEGAPQQETEAIWNTLKRNCPFL